MTTNTDDDKEDVKTDDDDDDDNNYDNDDDDCDHRHPADGYHARGHSHQVSRIIHPQLIESAVCNPWLRCNP